MTFHDHGHFSTTFQAWKIPFLNSMTFQDARNPGKSVATTENWSVIQKGARVVTQGNLHHSTDKQRLQFTKFCKKNQHQILMKLYITASTWQRKALISHHYISQVKITILYKL